MNGAGNVITYPVYPRRYFDESKTWFAWNKLCIVDICNLREEPGFEGQDVYFFLNHPIRFVRLVGILVDINLIPRTNLCLITIDDCSGANIEAKTRRDQITLGMGERTVEYLPTTATENLHVNVRLGATNLLLDAKPLEIGVIVRVEGTITSFRGERQIDLKRLFRVQSTTEEVKHWMKVKSWKEAVLNQPWVLTEEQRTRVDQRMEQEQQRRLHKSRSLRKRTEHDQKKDLAREEKRRAREIRYNAGALKGSNMIPTPWED